MAAVPRLLAVLALLCLALPASAPARDTIAPPGNSAIDQYLETVPAAGGNRPAGGGGGGSGSSVLSAAKRKHLRSLGPDGRTLAAVTDATAPQPARPARPKRHRPARGPAAPAHQLPTTGGTSPLGTAIGVAGGRDDGVGLGWLLPTILVATALAAVALVLARRRSGPSKPAS